VQTDTTNVTNRPSPISPCKRTINLIRGGQQPVLCLEASPGVGSTDSCQQSRTDSVTGDIRQGHYHLAIGRELPVIVISAGLIGR
jgi:hypothetical protein